MDNDIGLYFKKPIGYGVFFSLKYCSEYGNFVITLIFANVYLTIRNIYETNDQTKPSLIRNHSLLFPHTRIII